MAIFTNHFKLAKINEHLQDIFSDDHYLELGNLNTIALSKLLKHKLVRYSDLTYFDIQNKGLGTSDINNIKLKEKIPYFYFENFSHKDVLKKLFITYGILTQRRGYKEYFTPIILLPVDMIIDGSDIWFKMTGRPIENPYLANKTKVEFTDRDRFYDVYELDNFCIDNFKNEKQNLRLESYLTFASVTIPYSNFSNEKFNQSELDVTNVKSGFNISKDNNICNITSLNHVQRICLEEASYGMSFAISGIPGTGKTTTLVNIASSAVNNNKKVLYVSNNEETLDEVSLFFKNKGLSPLLINLSTLPIKKNEKYEFNPIVSGEKTFVRSELETKYDGIKEYTKALYDKINGFRYLDIAKGLIEYKDASNDLNKDVLEGIENLYKLEVDEIEKALENIDENLSKIDSFKNSKYNNIPIKNQSSFDDIIYLVKGLCDNFASLFEYKKTLENSYGFSAIPNYAYFRNIINNYFMLEKNSVPKSWLEFSSEYNKKKRLVNFDKAKELFDDFKKELSYAREKEEELREEYNTEYLDELDINYATSLISSKFEKRNNVEINAFLKNNKALIEKISKIKKVMEECEYNFGKMRDKIGVKVNYRDTESINQIVPFIEFFEKNKIPKAWLDIKNSDGIKKSIVATKHKIEKYEKLVSVYNTYFSDLSNIDNNINFLVKRSEKSKTYRGALILELIHDLNKLKEMDGSIDEAYKQFYFLTLENYPGSDVIKKFDTLILLVNNIKEENIQNKLIKNLTTLKGARLEEFIKPFILFSKSYNEIMRLYNELNAYFLVDAGEDLPDKMNKINQTYDYCMKIYEIQLIMNKLIKRMIAYVPYQEYIALSKKMEDLVEVRSKIEGNEEYKEVYGVLFDGYFTKVNEIEKVIYRFSQYINIFTDNDAIKNSINTSTSITLDEELTKAYKTCENVNELIKDYSKTFRDGTGKYYYDNMNSIIEHDKKLLSETDELKIYLKLTRGLQVLLNHKLYNFNEYIINHDKEVFKDRFMIAYYTYLYKEFVKKNGIVKNGEGFYKLLEDILSLENKVCIKNLDSLRTYLPHIPIPSFHGLNYEKYLKRIRDSKSLFLASTKDVSEFVDVNMFDLVLIDDANLSESDVYAKLLSCNQVIVAGINNIRVGISNDVLTKIKNNAIIELNKRNIATPLDLAENMLRASSDFYPDVEDNKGIKISSDDMTNIIISLITQDMVWDESYRVKLNKDIRINCFVRDLGKIRKLFDDISSNLANLNINLEDIYYVLRKQINISDLHSGYLWNADYNIIDLDDYNEENNIYENKNLISNLICAKKRLYIIDSNNLLKKNNMKGFVKEVKSLFTHKDIIYPITDKFCLKVAASLAEHKMQVLGQYRHFDILVKRKNRYFGIMIFNSPSNYGKDILNSYRDQSLASFPFKVLYVNDFILDYNKCILDIVKEVKNEN